MKHFMTSEKAVHKADDSMEFCNSKLIQLRVADILVSLMQKRIGVNQNLTFAEFINRKTISINKISIKAFHHKTIAARDHLM